MYTPGGACDPALRPTSPLMLSPFNCAAAVKGSRKSIATEATIAIVRRGWMFVICQRTFTHRNPRWFVPVVISPLPRVPTM